MYTVSTEHVTNVTIPKHNEDVFNKTNTKTKGNGNGKGKGKDKNKGKGKTYNERQV